jgi:ribosomal protein S18 acetylase RimI-like enzyme
MAVPLPPVGAVVAWRPLTHEDSAELGDLLARSCAADGHRDDSLTPDQVAWRLHDPGSDLARDSRAGLDAAGRIIAAGWVWCRPAPVRAGRAVLSFDVDPTARGQGIGSALLGWLEARAMERFAEELERGSARRIDVYAAGLDSGRGRLAVRAGYRPLRWFVRMTRPIAADLADRRELPAGLSATPWGQRLDEATRDACNDSFRDHFGFEPIPSIAWRHRISGDPRFLPEQSRLAIVGDLVVGFVLCLRGGGAGDTLAGPSAWLDSIGVRRGWRRMGVASALIARSLTALGEAGFRTALLEVDAESPTGALGLYERHGFRAVHREVILARELPAAGTMPAASPRAAGP